MNKSIVTLLFVSLFLVVALVGIGSSSNGYLCNTGLTQGGNTCNVTSSITLNGSSIFYLNGTTEGVLRVLTSHIVIDGNGSTLVGNYSNFFSGIYIDGSLFNITVKNFTIKNYYYGLRVITSKQLYINYNKFQHNNFGISYRFNALNSSIIENNTFINNINKGIVTETSSLKVSNITFIRNNFTQNSSSSIELFNFTDVNIIENIFYANSVHSPIAEHTNCFFEECNNWNIYNNSFYGLQLLSHYGPRFVGNNISLKYNFINGFGHSFYVYIPYNRTNINVTIENNVIQNGDDGMNIRNSRDIIIKNNKIVNMTYNIDTYQRCGWFKNSRDIMVDNNNCTLTRQGFNSQNVTNITIKNNQFEPMSWQNFLLTQDSDRRMQACSINFLELEKGWIGSNEESIPFSPFQDNRTNLIGNFKSGNIFIQNNTFNSNEDCYISGDGIYNITQDLINYWYIKLQTPVFLKDASEYWMNNNYNNLSWTGGTITDNSTTIPRYPQEYIWSTYQSSGRNTMQYNIGKEYLIFTNINYPFLSVNYFNLTYDNVSSFENSIFERQNSLIYFNNGTVLCSNISSCDGNYSFGLAVTNSSYVLDNFNLTEGISRQYSPLWFSSSSSTSKHIASNLSQTINDVTVIFNVDTCDISYIRFTPDSGSNVQTFTSGQWTCSEVGNQKQITLTLDSVEPAQDSNVILIAYQGQLERTQICSTLTGMYAPFFSQTGAIFAVLAAVIIIGIIGIFFFVASQLGAESGMTGFKMPTFDLELGKIQIAIVVFLILSILTVVSIIGINAVCSVGV